MSKPKTNKAKGITLIALVVTIIVLLILAGISIQMLSGDNGILQQATDARTKTIHANVFEQLQLEASAYTLDKSTRTYSNSLTDYLKSKSIISDISGEEDKWLINVTTLLGSNQSMGKGTYPNDVYVLEIQDISTGSSVKTKVAATMPIRIATTTENKITYIVKYYEDTDNEELTLGNIYDNDSQVVADDSEKLNAYFRSKDSYDSNGNYVDNDTIGIKVKDLFFLYNISNSSTYLSYNNSVYKYNGVIVIKTDSNLNLNKFGEYIVDGINVLVDSYKNIYKKKDAMHENALIGGQYMATDSETLYFHSEGGEIDFDRPFIGYIVKRYDSVNDISETIYYDLDGIVVDNIVYGGTM